MCQQHGVGGETRAAPQDRGEQTDEGGKGQKTSGDIAEIPRRQAGRTFEQNDQELEGAKAQQQMQSNKKRLSHAAQTNNQEDQTQRHGGEG